jgi:outer membrane protein TolC
LLRRRPDIRRAEQTIRAASARVGAAEADFFPRFRIGASAGVQNTDDGKFFDPLREFWSLGPSATWSLYNRGATRAGVEVQEALREQAMLDYRRTVLTALREVEDAMTTESRERARRVELEKADAASRRALELAEKLYQAGQVDYLQVLIARRTQLGSEEALSQNTADIASALAALYKALGGGW